MQFGRNQLLREQQLDRDPHSPNVIGGVQVSQNSIRYIGQNTAYSYETEALVYLFYLSRVNMGSLLIARLSMLTISCASTPGKVEAVGRVSAN